MKVTANKSNVKRMAWIVKWMDSKGDTYTEPFFKHTDAVFARSVRGGKLKEDIQVLSKFIYVINSTVEIDNDY